MSNARKLQAEIDRTLKKVQEGVQLFDDIWERVYSATQQSLKEKYEGELKKEIKKLQRFRDSIKSWASGNDIKDKRQLLDARRLIESKMEQFKVCEKETKTKAFSKEGLAQAARLDPADKARKKARNWLQDTIQTLSEQVEEAEADIESLQSKRGRRGQRNQRVDDLEGTISNHKFHIDMLEKITRLLDNKQITPEDVDSIQDDVEFYVESHDDEDFVFDYDMYEELDVETKIRGGLKVEDEPEPVAAVAKVAKKKKKKKQSSSIDLLSISGRGSARRKPSPAPAKAAAPAPAPAPAPVVKTPTPALPRRSAAAVVAGKSAKAAQAEARAAEERKAQAQAELRRQQALQEQKAQEEQRRQAQARKAAADRAAEEAEAARRAQEQQERKQQEDAERAQAAARLAAQAAARESSTPEEAPRSVPPPTNALNADKRAALDRLTQSLLHVPEPRDSENSKGYVPRNPYPTHPSFPTTPAPALQQPAVFEKFDPDTLFFIFYYQQGTYQQYLAARELKKQSWRFHKKYSTWFQRYEEPSETTDEYEQGTYAYFDYETGWCQRIKSGFTFEYSFLEDELSTP